MPVVFDFDKTLTNYDTLRGFYAEMEGRKVFLIVKRLTLLVFAVVYKLGIIDNNSLKNVGFQLFIKGRTRDFIATRARKYAKKIRFNKIYADDYMRLQDSDVYIVSASYFDYLEPLFPDAVILATGIEYSEDGVATRLARNMFGDEKRKALADYNIQQIDYLYTDSYSDKCLMDISKTVFMVKNGEKILLKGSLAG